MARAAIAYCVPKTRSQGVLRMCPAMACLLMASRRDLSNPVGWAIALAIPILQSAFNPRGPCFQPPWGRAEECSHLGSCCASKPNSPCRIRARGRQGLLNNFKFPTTSCLTPWQFGSLQTTRLNSSG